MDDIFDAVVIGSGPAGVWTAWGLRGLRVLVLDVGRRPPPERATADFRGPGRFGAVIGSEFESLYNVGAYDPISIKLKGPLLRYVAGDGRKLSPVVTANFTAVMSFAMGGLANAWGAGVYRFTARDLGDAPLSAEDLRPCYDEVGAEMGVCGVCDDLGEEFGAEPELLPPLELTRFAREMLENYRRRRAQMVRQHFRLGRSRLAVLTRPHNGRPAYQYDNLEFFQPWNRAIYNPAFTLEKMIAEGAVRYGTPYLASHFREREGRVEVYAQNLETGDGHTFRGRTLFLAAGAINSGKLALASRRDFQSRLPILDNPMAILPLLRWTCIGARREKKDTSLAQLNFVYEDPVAGKAYQGSVYTTTGALRTDVLFSYPLSIRAAMEADRVLAPAIGAALLFHPGRAQPGARMRLRQNFTLEIRAPIEALYGSVEAWLVKLFRQLGFWSHVKLCQFPRLGSAMHYAGTLPMAAAPGCYQTARDGRLAGYQGVYVTDGAGFASLPAKNLTYTIMANALRVARLARQRLS